MALERTVKKKPARTADRRNVWLLILTTILIVVSVVLFTPPNEKINQGLDIQGGLSVVLTAKSTDGEPVTPEDMEKSRAIIESRVNALGASEATVQEQGSDQILVQIPGLADTEEALATIGRTGSLEFARLDSFTDEEVKSAIESGQYAGEGTVSDSFGNSFPSGKTQNLEVEPGTYTPIVTGADITNVTVGKASETGTDYAVNISLNAQGTKAFAEASRDLVADHGQIVIILDGEVQSAPAVQSEIPNGEVSITGNYTLDEAKNLQTILESGSLPVSFEYAQSQVVGPTLGQDALVSGVIVALIGLALVMLYLLFFYKGLGLITAAAMAVFAVLYLGILAALSAFHLFSLSLAGIAGIVLTIGMAADSSILTVERFREEIRMGRSVKAASITGVRHAIFTSIDADLVTMVSALCLFFLAASSVKGFGMTLALGIICDIVMMLIFKAPLIRLLAPKVIAKHPGFWGIKDSIEASKGYAELAAIEGVPEAEAETGAQMNAAETRDIVEADDPADASKTVAAVRKIKGRFIKHDINFLGFRKVFLTVAAVAMVLCLVVVGVRGLNFGIEFVGGTSVAFHGTGDITTEQMRTAFDGAGEPDAVIQTTETNGEPGFLVRTTTTSAEDATARANQVADALGMTTSDFEVTTIGPDWGASVIQSSLIAFLVSILLIIVYIAIRFEYKMGVMAIVALLHDLILVVGIYALVGREVNPNTIAALLTILGYSLYDTVVVFHRINDNMKGEDIRCTFMT
ncbi:MAG: protein translocase subunit SecD, partial [Eggerthellaceae bacterium]|nr:protein translocase subunit SecD [Eggerthellaceae bacterium]